MAEMILCRSYINFNRLTIFACLWIFTQLPRRLFSWEPYCVSKKCVFTIFFTLLSQSCSKWPIKTLPPLHKHLTEMDMFSVAPPLLFSPYCDMTWICWAKWLWQIGIGNDKIGYLISMVEGIGLWCWVHSNKQPELLLGPAFDGSFHPSDGKILARKMKLSLSCYLYSGAWMCVWLLWLCVYAEERF